MITPVEALASAVHLALRDVDSRLAAYGPNPTHDPTFAALTNQRATYQRALDLAQGQQKEAA